MGGKSKSSQSTSNKQHTNNIVNDGEFAGAGEVYLDESETINTVEDSNNTDNSVTTTTEIEQDIDNSVTTEIEQDIDNSVNNDGEFAGVNGNITILDGGAIAAAESIAITALEESTKQNAAAVELSSRAIESNERTSKSAIDSNERTTARALNTAEFAIDEIQEVASDSVEAVGETTRSVIDSMTASSMSFAENLNATTQANFAANQQSIAAMGASNTEDKEIIAELAKNTSLAGQDIVARSSEKMTMYMAIAVGLGFVAMLFVNRRGA